MTMVMHHSEPSSGGGTVTFSLTSRPYSPDKTSLTPTSTLFGAAAKLSALSMHVNRHPRSLEDEERELELDVQAELRADGENPFRIDRRAVKEVVQENLGVRIDRIKFLSSGTFHKAFLLYLEPKRGLPESVVFRIARQTMHMPRLKTESEVATLAYLRTRSTVPVPTVYWYDASPYNVLGGEWMVMSKAPGLPLSKFYHTLPAATLRALLANLANMLIPLFEHRFPALGSLYFSTPPSPDLPPPGTVPLTTSSTSTHPDFTPGPIISYPFFGSSRGLLSHTTKPLEIDRGPWATFPEYLDACVQREIAGVVREGQGRAVGRRPRVAPTSEEGSGSDEDEDDWGVDWAKNGGTSSGQPSSFGSKGGFVVDDGDGDGDSDSGSSGTGTGDHESYYRDYRATQRSTFLVAHTARREASVREEMGVFLEVMTALRDEAEGGLGLGECGERGKRARKGGGGEECDVAGEEAFTLDCHDLSLENVFVDEHDHSKITCIIDWESTCIRPLFQAAHLPSFLQPHHGHGHHHGHHHSHTHPHHHHHHHHHHHRSHDTPHRPAFSRAHSSHTHAVPHTPVPRYMPSRSPAAQMFREEVARVGLGGARWLGLEQAGAKRRWAHRVVEWDGWEEGLAGEILGELEYGWEVEGGGGGGRKGRGEVGGRRGGRDVSEDGGRELGRRLEMWVREGAREREREREQEQEHEHEEW